MFHKRSTGAVIGRARYLRFARVLRWVIPACLAAAPVLRSVMTAPILPLVDAAALLPPRGGLLGLDLGTKTIGIAVSDPDRRLATAVETIQRTNFTADAKRVLALAAERRCAGFVLGLPLNMDDAAGSPRAIDPRQCPEPSPSPAESLIAPVGSMQLLDRGGRARAHRG